MNKNILFSTLLLFSTISAGHTKDVETYNINDIEKMYSEEIKGLTIEVYNASEYFQFSSLGEREDPYRYALTFDLYYQLFVIGGYNARSLIYRERREYQRRMNTVMQRPYGEQTECKQFEKWLTKKGWVEASTELAIRSDNEWYRCTNKVDNLNPSFLAIIRQSGSDVTKYVYIAYGSFSGDERNYDPKKVIQLLVHELVSKNKL